LFGYIVRRLLAAALVVIVISMMTFAMFFYGPSDPAGQLCAEQGQCTTQKREALEHSLGFDESGVSQYGTWVKGLFSDRTIDMGVSYECAAPCLGISFNRKTEVRELITAALPATASLALVGASLYFVVGIVVGSFAAKYRGSSTDRGVVAGSLLISSIPYYLFALLAWIYLINKWSIFPDSGYTPLTENPAAWFSGLLLPWLVLAAANMVNYARFCRGSMVEVLGEDYVRTAVAKGVPRNRAIFKHGLRAAIVPVVTIFGLDLATLLAGAIFTEYIFEIDGVGKLALDSIEGIIDFPILSAVVLISAILVVVANLVVDILYTAIDPRVRLV
jgi:peptide/nickel transport system permease protein